MCQMDQLRTCCNKRPAQRFTQDRSKQGVGSSCVLQGCRDSNECIHDSSENGILLLMVPLC